MPKTYTIQASEATAHTDTVDSYTFGCTYQPKTDFKLWYVKDEGFYLHMTCQESNPKAIYTKDMDPVYKDSCMEFFMSFYPELPVTNYINFEMNSNGALLTVYHDIIDGINHKTFIIDTFDGYVRPTVCDTWWGVELFIPEGFIKKAYQTDKPLGPRFTGNVYKCGDETASRHFGSWNPITLDEPDFHRPEFFGDFILAD